MSDKNNFDISVSAPGSVMLMGEHAVLHGHAAIVASVNVRIYVSLRSREDDAVHIQSSLGNFSTTTKSIEKTEPFEFILSALSHFQSQLPSGLDIEIKSEFSHQVGLGSSAAVTVALIAALRKWLGLEDSPKDIFQVALNVIHQVQGVGSGADIAASAFGGVLRYQVNESSEPANDNEVVVPVRDDKSFAHIEKIDAVPPIFLFYSGSKTPTPSVIQYVNHLFRGKTDRLHQLYGEIADCVGDALDVLKKKDWEGLGELFVQQQSLMEEMGLNTAALQAIINDMANRKNVYGAKISGAGLGDSIVVLADDDPALYMDPRCIPVVITKNGVIYL